jgi:hypothetical protein
METFLTYAGFILGIIGLVASYYFYRKSIRIKEPVYSIKSNNLISGSASTLENLSVIYKDEKVNNLTVSKVLFYNRGGETITGKDIVNRNFLKISSKSCDVLDSSVIEVNNSSNNFSVYYDKPSKIVAIDFDYLDQNQGAVIQVIHTGLSSEDITVQGDVMGVQNIVNLRPDRFSVYKTEMSIGLRLIVSLISISIILGSFWWASSRQQYPLILNLFLAAGIVGILIGIIGDLSVFSPFISLPAWLRRSSEIPRGLEKIP